MNLIAGNRSVESSNAVSVWSKITIQNADAYSTIYERPPDDCMRPKWVKCFSIQQNFWIIDSSGNSVLWAQNVIDLAKFNGIYYGTYSFELWTVKPLAHTLCEPESENNTVCRAPFYTSPVRFPDSLTFYAHISTVGFETSLHMSNRFGTVDWKIPPAINCPCFIGTLRTGRQPWGYSPFEFVMVGLDSLALAIFGNETMGTFGPILTEAADGVWYRATLGTLKCSFVGECPTPPGTGETSMNLQWNITSGLLQWVAGAYDQGVYIKGISNSETTPTLPNPIREEYLYTRLSAAVGYLTIYDEQSRELGFDQVSGQWVQQISNSTIIFTRNSEEILMLNPGENYKLVVTAGGNTAFRLFSSKSTNFAGVLATATVGGTLKMGESKHFTLDYRNMQIKNEDTEFQTIVRAPDFDLISLITLWGVTVVAILIFLRRRARKHPLD